MAGTIVASNISDGTNTGTTTDVIRGSARAWVNFNGTGTVAIRSSYNVSSITDQGTGTYDINLSNSMSDINYSVITSGMIDNTSASVGYYSGIRTDNGVIVYKTKSSIRISVKGQDLNLRDGVDVNAAIFR